MTFFTPSVIGGVLVTGGPVDRRPGRTWCSRRVATDLPLLGQLRQESGNQLRRRRQGVATGALRMPAHASKRRQAWL